MSEIKYPCVMEHKREAGLLVWFNKEYCGITVEIGENRANKIGYETKTWTMSNFKPYVRPKEYEYQVLYKCKDSFMLGLTNNFYKDANEFEARNFRLLGYDSIEMLEQSRREVK